MNDQLNLLKNDLNIDSAAMGHLKETVTWTRLLGVLGFGYGGIVAVIGIVAGVKISGIARNYRISGERLAEGAGAALVYLVLALAIFFTSLQLYRFSKKIKNSIRENNQELFNLALKNLKNYFRLAGVISIIALLFSLLLVISFMIESTYSRY